jgi:tetratricopeptide (TPR) repeat protein
MKKYALFTITVIVLAALTLGTGCGRDPLDAGIRAVENGNLPKAEALFATMLEQDPGDVSALMNLSIVRLKTGNTEAALSGFRQVADQTTEDVLPLAYMADIYMDNNRWREAAEVLNEATRRDSRSPAIMTAQALVELYTTGAASARDRLVHVLAMAPSYAPALFNMAVIERDWLKNPVEGRKYFQRYLAIAKNDSHTPIARAALLERATPPTRKAVSAELPPAPAKKLPPVAVPAPPTARDPKMATEAFTLAVRYHQSHDTEKAIREYSRALQYDPMRASAHFNLGLLLREKGDLEKARDSFEHALECAPGMTDARYMLGLILNTLGDESGATTQFTTILEKAPNHAASHLALGLIYKKDKAKLALARKELSRYLELDPDGASAKEVKNWLKYQR